MKDAVPKLKIALGADFLTAFSRLPQKQQKKVREFLDKFTENPAAPTHNYEHIQGARDPNLRSVRIDGNYRGIVLKPEHGNVYVLLWVDAHDAAYQWAAQRTCTIHPGTGTVQVVLTEEAAAESLAGGPKTAEPPAPVAAIAAPPRLFAQQTDAEILSLGVPEALLKLVREAADDAELERLEPVLPREGFEGLFLVAAGYSVSEARNELGLDQVAAIDTTDFSAAVERPGSRRQFVLVSDASEMESILSAPLEQWRVFLHPSQRRLVEMAAAGPARVLGSAGTGKTVVAMHRAVWLARKVCTEGQKVLFTTFTKNLAADIAANLKSICSRDEWERIEVVHLDAWVRRFLEKQSFPLKLAYDEAVRGSLWEKAMALLPPELNLPAGFPRAEWDNVVQAQGVEDLPAYMGASRVGRPRRLTRQERYQLWPVFAEYRALLDEGGLCEPADAFRTAARLIRERAVTFPYRAVVVDEAQDFGNEAFRLIRAMLPAGANDLFIVGDAHQRLYGQQVVLSRCGIDIRGRGRKLRINYRTPEEVKNWATGLLKGLAFDDLDAGVDDTEGIRSIVHGEPPLVQTCTSVTAAAEAVCAHITQLLKADSARPETICLVARTHHELDEYQKYVSQACSAIHRIETGKADDRNTPGIRLATIYRVKGLEFDHVIIAGALDDADASPDAVERTTQNRALLYVAATRARKSLLVCRVSQGA
jgi:superfamily I DNA/RNA helicase/mRNA-degrading endonuclease RelE of RelBE toxin-antitoxin system